MKNRYLPILHENISLGELCASNEPRSGGTSLPARSLASRSLAEGRRFGEGRWAVKIEFEDLDYCTQRERSLQ